MGELSTSEQGLDSEAAPATTTELTVEDARPVDNSTGDEETVAISWRRTLRQQFQALIAALK
jgi:hypothetical protein